MNTDKPRQEELSHEPDSLSNSLLQSPGTQKFGQVDELIDNGKLLDGDAFTHSPVSITKEDWSKAKRITDQLRASGVADFRRYVRTQPEILADLAPAVKIFDTNEAAARTYKASDVRELLHAFNAPPDLETYNPITGFSDIFVELIQRFSNGETRVVLEGPDTALDGSVLYIRTTTSILKGSENDWDRIVQTVEEIKPSSCTIKDGLALRERFIALTNQQRVADGLLNSLSTPALLVDDKGTVIEVNDSASRFFSKDRGLRLCRGRISTLFRSEQECLKNAIKTSTRQVTSHHKFDRRPARLQLSRWTSNRPYSVTISPLPRSYFSGGKAAAAVIYIHDPEDACKSDISDIAKFYRLTFAEQTLCQQLIAGKSVIESAKVLGITEGTARERLKNVFRKTDTNSQASLIRLLMLYNPV